ncbi:MAG: hypothetical protein IPN88_19285 [Bacteroidetes bacterium]|nr:hypothetical protein [Bacteroidota bacterium]
MKADFIRRIKPIQRRRRRHLKRKNSAPQRITSVTTGSGVIALIVATTGTITHKLFPASA